MDARETALADLLAATFLSPADRDEARALLALYGSEAGDREPERVRLAIVQLAKGRLDELAALIDAARVDYRDVLMWATHPASAQDAERVRALLSRLRAHRRPER